MRKIDWYILKKFLVTFIFCTLLFTVIAVAVDSSEKTDDFVKANLNTAQIIEKYYLGFVPWIWSLLFPLFVFIAVIFFTSRLATRSEVIAILASGTSYNRFLRPYLVGGVLLAVLLWFGSNYWIPRANVIKADFQTQYLDKDKQKEDLSRGDYYKRIDSLTYMGMKNYDTGSKTAGRFFLNRVRENKIIYNLRADAIRWDTAVKKWQLTNAVERSIDSIGEKVTVHPTYALSFNLLPGELRRDEYLKDKLTTPELDEYIQREELRGTEGLNAYKVEKYRRTATPAAVVLLSLIGAVIASRKTRGGSGMHIALGITIAAIFIISDRFSTVFATQGSFPPLIAAWLPNIVFTGVAFWIYKKTPK